MSLGTCSPRSRLSPYSPLPLTFPQKSQSEYDLILQNDINSKGNTQWFFFSVANTRKGQTVKFNIVNLVKKDSLFNYGMKIVIYSEKSEKLSSKG